MKTIEIPQTGIDVVELLEHARNEDILLRTADGREFMLFALDGFDAEVAAARRNEKLMAFLDERARERERISLKEVKKRFGIE